MPEAVKNEGSAYLLSQVGGLEEAERLRRQAVFSAGFALERIKDLHRLQTLRNCDGDAVFFRLANRTPH